MTYRDLVVKKLRRRGKALKKDPEQHLKILKCISELKMKEPTESRDSVHRVLLVHGVEHLLGGDYGRE